MTPEEPQLLRMVIALDVKVDQLLRSQKDTRDDIAGLDTRIRQVENKVAALESDQRRQKSWPTVMSAIASLAAVVLSVFVAITH